MEEWDYALTRVNLFGNNKKWQECLCQAKNHPVIIVEKSATLNMQINVYYGIM